MKINCYVLAFLLFLLCPVKSMGQGSSDKKVSKKNDFGAYERRCIEVRGNVAMIAPDSLQKCKKTVVSSSSVSRRKGIAVDLGLSVKWANCNVGANAPEEYGGYYAWGETEEKSDYTKETYKHYCAKYNFYITIGSDISGSQYDVAHVKWGGNWRMPTHAEIKELVEKCKSEKITYKGVSGYKFTGPNGNSIFLPTAGWRDGTDVNGRGDSGDYWSATLKDRNFAYDLDFYSGNMDWDNFDSFEDGCSVRPVTK